MIVHTSVIDTLVERIGTAYRSPRPGIRLPTRSGDRGERRDLGGRSFYIESAVVRTPLQTVVVQGETIAPMFHVLTY